jgi:4-hydroxybenzoate polyprenyltransferase
VRRVEGARALLGACHPGPAFAVTLLAGLLAGATGLGPARVALVVAAVLTGQLSIGWSNDLIDLGRDRAVGREDKPLVDGRISPRAVRIACGLALVATVPLSLACGWVAGLVHLV